MWNNKPEIVKQTEQSVDCETLKEIDEEKEWSYVNFKPPVMWWMKRD